MFNQETKSIFIIMWKDLKYLLAYIIPAIVAHALYYKGIWSYNGVTVSFI